VRGTRIRTDGEKSLICDSIVDGDQFSGAHPLTRLLRRSFRR
jgi:hypothetical protein